MEPLSKIPDGVRYYFGREARLRRSIENAAMNVFAGWSYEEITTPTVDYYSLFEHAMGHSASHGAFRFTDNDGRLLALRPDVTSAVARAAATIFAARQRPLRFCYVGPVFRQHTRSPAEWLRESTQIGCELIGADTHITDMEVLLIICELLRNLNLTFLITLNQAEVFNGLTSSILADVVRDEVRTLVARRNVSDLEGFLAQQHATEKHRQGLIQLMKLSGKGETLTRAREVISNERSLAALARLEKLWILIESLDLSNHFEIDLGNVSPLNYYSGLTFKIYVEGAGRPAGSGGRYDGLTATFGASEPAVGFVLELDTITDLVAKVQGPITPERKDHSLVADFNQALERRREGLRVLVDLKEASPCL